MEASSLPGQRRFAMPKPLLARAGDERLVEQLRRGNDAAFEVIYDRYHAALLSFCRHMLGSREEAEDALQHALVAAHEDILRSTKPIRLKAWLYTIARNRCLSVLRARREQPSEEIEISTAGLSESVQQRADVRELLTDLHALPEEQRAALVLSELGDLSHAEVAAVVGCEVSKVKSLVFQARSSLIERRQAREIPCMEIREQLANLSGGALRRGHLRHHLASCDGCRDFRDEVRKQRKVMAAALPVIPTLGLKSSALAAVGGGGSGGGAAIAGGAAGGGLATAFGGGVAKVVVIAAVAAGAATGGSVATGSGVPFVGSDSEPAAAEGPNGRGAGALPVFPADAGKSDGKEGFEPVRGESNGERAREFAKTRGKGKKKGLYRERAARRKARAERARRTRSARPAPTERSATERSTPERTAPVRPTLPERTAPVKPVAPPPPPPVVEEPVAPVAPPPPPPELVAPDGSAPKVGGGGKLK